MCMQLESKMNYSKRLQAYETKKKNIMAAFKRHLSTDNGTTFALSKKTSNLFRHREKNCAKMLDVKDFNKVICIDAKNCVANIEAMITYEDLINESLKYSLMPPVVPELKTITVGGALSGLGIEASSFRYGLVHETIDEIEVLTGNGEVLLCRADNEYQDLFYAFPNSYGTLGYALRVKLKLIPTEKYVKLTHYHFNDGVSFFSEIHRLCLQQRLLATDSFVEGTVFSKNEMHITLGQFEAVAPCLSNYTYMDIYYQSIRKKDEDYLCSHDFIWRWDADWFWCSTHFGMHHWFLRLLFGKFMLKSATYWQISHWTNQNPVMKYLRNRFQASSEAVIQDVLIPIENAPMFLNFLLNEIQITPIWACPYQAYTKENSWTFINLDPSVLYIDFGFWDLVPSEKPKGYYNRLIEHKLLELKGFKSLYSDSFYSEQEFWQIYSKKMFDALKKKYDPHFVFKNLYEKVSTL